LRQEQGDQTLGQGKLKFPTVVSRWIIQRLQKRLIRRLIRLLDMHLERHRLRLAGNLRRLQRLRHLLRQVDSGSDRQQGRLLRSQRHSRDSQRYRMAA